MSTFGRCVINPAYNGFPKLMTIQHKYGSQTTLEIFSSYFYACTHMLPMVLHMCKMTNHKIPITIYLLLIFTFSYVTTCIIQQPSYDKCLCRLDIKSPFTLFFKDVFMPKTTRIRDAQMHVHPGRRHCEGDRTKK